MQGCVGDDGGAAAAAAAAAAPQRAAGLQPPLEPAAWCDDPCDGQLGGGPSGVDSESDDLDFEHSGADYEHARAPEQAPARVKKYTARRKHLLCHKCLAADPGAPVWFTCGSALRLHDTRKHGAHPYECQVPSCGRCFATRQDHARHCITDHHDRASSAEYHRHRQDMRHGDKTRHSSLRAHRPEAYYQRQQKRRDAYAAKRSNGGTAAPCAPLKDVHHHRGAPPPAT